MSIPLRLGAMPDQGLAVSRSRPHWLLSDGARCRRGEVAAIFNIGVETTDGADRNPFRAERTFQLGLAAPVDGRLRLPPDYDDGTRDVRSAIPWESDHVVAAVDPEDGATASDEDPRRLFLAGRRIAWEVDTSAGPIGTWHLRYRGWWTVPGTAMSHLACIGICDAAAVVRGPRAFFGELFETTPFSLHVSHVSDHPLVPCSRVLIDQLERGPAEIDAIIRDLGRGLVDGPVTPTPEDWVYAGALLQELCASPLTTGDTVLGVEGLTTVGPPDTVLLSIASEPRRLFRHRTLGHHLHVMPHDLEVTGPAMRAWLKANFEPVRRSMVDIEADIERLCALAGARTGARFLVINLVSSTELDTLVNYAGFGATDLEHLSRVGAKECNAMLDGLAERGIVGVLDADALAAEVGTTDHAPDGIHCSRSIETALREDLVAALARFRRPD